MAISTYDVAAVYVLVRFFCVASSRKVLCRSFCGLCGGMANLGKVFGGQK